MARASATCLRLQYRHADQADEAGAVLTDHQLHRSPIQAGYPVLQCDSQAAVLLAHTHTQYRWLGVVVLELLLEVPVPVVQCGKQAAMLWVRTPPAVYVHTHGFPVPAL